MRPRQGIIYMNTVGGQLAVRPTRSTTCSGKAGRMGASPSLLPRDGVGGKEMGEDWYVRPSEINNSKWISTGGRRRRQEKKFVENQQGLCLSSPSLAALCCKGFS